MYEFIHRVCLAVMVPELTHDLALNPAQFGWLSAAYFYAYALMQIPVGFLLDRYSVKYILFWASILIAASSITFAHTSSAFVALFCRALIGLGSAFSFVGCMKVGASLFSSRKFALIVGLSNLLGAIGGILGGKPLAIGVALFGWRLIILALGVAGIIISLAIVLGVNHVNPKTTNKIAKFKPKNLTASLLNPKLLLISTVAGLIVAPIASYVELWGPTFLHLKYGLLREHAALISTITFLGIAAGGPLVGWLSYYVQNIFNLLLIGIIGAFLSLAAIIFQIPQTSGMLVFLHLLFGFCSSFMLLCFSINNQYANPNNQALVVAITNTFIMLIGASTQVISSKILKSTTAYDVIYALVPLLLCQVLAIILLIKVCISKKA